MSGEGFFVGLKPGQTIWHFDSVSRSVEFFSVQKWKQVQSLSCVQLLATPWTITYQAPLSMIFSRQTYWKVYPINRIASPLQLSIENMPSHLGLRRKMERNCLWFLGSRGTENQNILLGCKGSGSSCRYLSLLHRLFPSLYFSPHPKRGLPSHGPHGHQALFGDRSGHSFIPPWSPVSSPRLKVLRHLDFQQARNPWLVEQFRHRPLSYHKV